MDYLTLGSTPYDEDCAQVGSETYYEMMKKETAAYIHQLYRIYNKRYPAAEQAIIIYRKSFPHDFGSYHEVCAVYNENNRTSCEQAAWLETHSPGNWDEEAIKELGEEYFTQLEKMKEKS